MGDQTAQGRVLFANFEMQRSSKNDTLHQALVNSYLEEKNTGQSAHTIASGKSRNASLLLRYIPPIFARCKYLPLELDDESRRSNFRR